MTFSFCSTDHNQVFLNGEKPLKNKRQVYLCTFQDSSSQPGPYYPFRKSCMIWFIEYDTSILPPNSAYLKINGTMLYYNVGKKLRKIT